MVGRVNSYCQQSFPCTVLAESVVKLFFTLAREKIVFLKLKTALNCGRAGAAVEISFNDRQRSLCMRPSKLEFLSLSCNKLFCFFHVLLFID